MRRLRPVIDWGLARSPDGLKRLARRVLPQSVVRRLQRAGRPSGGAGNGSGYHRAPTLPLEQLNERLWGGYAAFALEELERVRLSPRSRPSDALRAASLTARYYAAREEHETALERIAFIRASSPRAASARSVRFVELASLLALGRLDDARFLIDKTLQGASAAHSDAAVMRAGVARLAEEADADAEAARAEYYEWLNRPLARAGFRPIAPPDPSRPPALDNLAAPADSPDSALADDGPLVSVLMAAFNAADNIEVAVNSVLEQTWRRLEVVIVDDASTDDTWAVMQRLAERDERVRPLQHRENGGAYVARNTALAAARGTYVVVNDADDWAHPEKIEAQVRDLEAHDGQGANMTFRLRVDSDLVPVVRLDSPHTPVIHNDFSALMLAREKVLELGGWDPVRFSADAEFVFRLRRAEGDSFVRKIHADVPLSISLFEATNLTASSATSIWTNRFGARREYERAFRHWHATADSLRIDRQSQDAPFPVPGVSWHAPGTRQHFDVILVSDFRLPGGTTHCNLQYLRAFRQAGLRVAWLHWARCDITPRDPGTAKIVDACHELGVVPLAHGEEAYCDLLLIHHPPVMMWQPDAIPAIEADRIVILANQSSQRVRGGPNELYDPAVVQQQVERNFGQRGTWIPISPVVRGQMQEVGGFEPIWHEDWLPVLDLETWHREPHWRGAERGRPVIGRHSRDQWIKWPGSAEDIASAYCVGEDVDVRLMGGANSALQTLGRRPANWQILDFDAEPVPDFLAGLDIYVHFIHEDSIEAFGRNILEAMATGLPVICSPSFRACFGDGALYAEPPDVKDVIASLWKDPERYLAVAQAGQLLVGEACTLSAVTARLQRLQRALSRDIQGCTRMESD